MQDISLNSRKIPPKCYLSKYNTDLELSLSEDMLSAKTREESGFEWLWRSTLIYKIRFIILILFKIQGTKANFGVKGGKYMYECRLKRVIKSNNLSQNITLYSERE